MTIDADTLRLLADSMQRYGDDKYRFESRGGRQDDGGWSRAAWSDYASMGWLALPMALDDGGFGSDPAAVGALMRFAGEHLALEPLFANVVLCGRAFGLAGRHPVALRALESLASGDRIFAFAHNEDAGHGVDVDVRATWRDGRLTGRKVVVLHGDLADELVVTARDADSGSLCLVVLNVDQPGVQRTPYRLLDRRGAASFQLRDAAASRFVEPERAAQVLEQCLTEARLALCAEAHAAVSALNRLTLAYLKDRRQFGRPIGTNQVLQHRMVECYLLEQEMAAVISAARRGLRVGAPPDLRAVLAAVAHVIAAGRHVSHEAVQMHGGIGITDELAVSHYFTRLMVVNRLLGDREWHLGQFACLGMRR